MCPSQPDEPKVTDEAGAPVSSRQENLLNYALLPFDHGVAAMERQLLRLGVPVEMMARIMMQHAASLCVLIEPVELRAQIMQKLIRNFPAQVQIAKVESAKTPGGVIVPNGAHVEERTGRPI